MLRLVQATAFYRTAGLRCAHVAVMDEADENLAVNQERNKIYTNITYGL